MCKHSERDSYLTFVHSLHIFEQRLNANLIEESHCRFGPEFSFNEVKLFSALIVPNSKLFQLVFR